MGWGLLALPNMFVFISLAWSTESADVHFALADSAAKTLKFDRNGTIFRKVWQCNIVNKIASHPPLS